MNGASPKSADIRHLHKPRGAWAMQDYSEVIQKLKRVWPSSQNVATLALTSCLAVLDKILVAFVNCRFGNRGRGVYQGIFLKSRFTEVHTGPEKCYRLSTTTPGTLLFSAKASDATTPRLFTTKQARQHSCLLLLAQTHATWQYASVFIQITVEGQMMCAIQLTGCSAVAPCILSKQTKWESRHHSLTGGTVCPLPLWLCHEVEEDRWLLWHDL